MANTGQLPSGQQQPSAQPPSGQPPTTPLSVGDRLVITFAILFFVAAGAIWIASDLHIIANMWSTVLSPIFTVLGVALPLATKKFWLFVTEVTRGIWQILKWPVKHSRISAVFFFLTTVILVLLLIFRPAIPFLTQVIPTFVVQQCGGEIVKEPDGECIGL